MPKASLGQHGFYVARCLILEPAAESYGYGYKRTVRDDSTQHDQAGNQEGDTEPGIETKKEKERTAARRTSASAETSSRPDRLAWLDSEVASDFFLCAEMR
ncbi:MAG: hypothetical protein MK110_17650 [Fuerstiella sp.]|nr:hypothetical protein [Fuerstiella sp.]